MTGAAVEEILNVGKVIRVVEEVVVVVVVGVVVVVVVIVVVVIVVMLNVGKTIRVVAVEGVGAIVVEVSSF